MKKKTWTKKSLGKNLFTARWEKRGKDRYLVLSSPTYGANFEANSFQMLKQSGWRAK